MTQRIVSLEQGAALIEQMMAGHTLSSLLGRSEESQETLYHVGHLLYGQGKYVEAMRIFAYLLTNNHLDRRHYIAFAACLQMERRCKDALKYYGIASLLDLTDPEPAMYSAECHAALGDRAKARESLVYALAQARAYPRHAALVERMEGILSLLDAAQSTH